MVPSRGLAGSGQRKLQSPVPYDFLHIRPHSLILHSSERHIHEQCAACTNVPALRYMCVWSVFTLDAVASGPRPPWLVWGAAVGYGAASGVCGKDLPTKAYPQGTSRRKDAARDVDGGPEHAAGNADLPRITSDTVPPSVEYHPLVVTPTRSDTLVTRCLRHHRASSRSMRPAARGSAK